MTTRSVHTVVVAYHAADELERCLAALGENHEVTVIDNSSSAEVQSVASRHGATYVDPGSNLGFGAGVNLALRRIMVGLSRDVLLLNPDAVLAPRDIQVLADFLHRPGSERIAALSPRLVGSDGASQRVEWPFPTPRGAWAEAVGLGRLLQGSRTFVIPVRKLARRPASAGRPGSRRRLQGSRTFVIPVRKLARRPASAGRPGSRRRLQGSRTFVIPVRKLARRPASAGRPGSRRRLQGSRTFVIGAVMLLRWEALLEVGPLRRAVLPLRRGDRLAAAGGSPSAGLGRVHERARRASRRRDEPGSSTSRDALPRRPGDVHPEVARPGRVARLPRCGLGWSVGPGGPPLRRSTRRGAVDGRLLYLRGPRRCARLVRE